MAEARKQIGIWFDHYNLKRRHQGLNDEETPMLRVLLEGDVDHRVERVGDVHDRLGIVGDDDPEDSTKIFPGDLARLDGVGGLLREDRVYEAVALTVFAGFQRSHPAGIELELLAGAAVGGRDGESAFTEPKFRDGEAVQGRVTDVDSLPQKKLAPLGQPDAILDEAGDRLPVLLADRPSLPVGTPRTCSEGGEIETCLRTVRPKLYHMASGEGSPGRRWLTPTRTATGAFTPTSPRYCPNNPDHLSETFSLR